MKQPSFAARVLSWIPSCFTVGNGLSGLAAIVVVVSQQFPPHVAVALAAGLVGLGMLLDMLDGPLARRLGCASDIGARLDAMSDLVSFGTAPAVLAWYVVTDWSLASGGMLVPMAAGLYIGCAALRLARFLASNRPDRVKAFRGLPTPAAAGLLIAALLLAQPVGDVALPADAHPVHRNAIIGLMLAIGILMLSPFNYERPISWLRHSVGRVVLGSLVLAAFVGLATWPRHTIAIAFGLYALTGPGLVMVGWLRTWLVARVEAS